MWSVSEPLSSRQKPRDHAELSDLTLIVRPPGDPDGVRAFTEQERADAEMYASQTGTQVESLP